MRNAFDNMGRNVGRHAMLIAACVCMAAPLATHAHGHDGHHTDVEVLVAPETEHWPSNYVPDNYRLKGYDGQPNRVTTCRGAHGFTLSTTARPCPDGQTPLKLQNSWTTNPNN